MSGSQKLSQLRTNLSLKTSIFTSILAVLSCVMFTSQILYENIILYYKE